MIYEWHWITYSSSDSLKQLFFHKVDKPLEDTDMNKQALVYKVLGWYPANLVSGYLASDQSCHGPNDVKCRSCRNSFCHLKCVQKMLISQIYSCKVFAGSGIICLCHLQFCCIKHCLSSHSWHQSDIKAQNWHKLYHSSGWFDSNMIICPCLIWMKPVLLLKTIMHRSGVNISLSHDGRACLCQKVMWNSWNVSVSHPSPEVWVARSKTRHHMVARDSLQITPAQWPQLSTAAACNTNSRESILQDLSLCCAAASSEAAGWCQTIPFAEQTRPLFSSCLLFFGFGFGLFVYALQMQAWSTLPKFSRCSLACLCLYSTHVCMQYYTLYYKITHLKI